MASVWGELRRRNVFKVAVAYAIVAWLLIQVADIVLPTFNAPDWIVPVFTVFLILGFPLILLFAWAFEVTPEGVERTREVPLERSITQITGRKIEFAIIGLLAAAVAFMFIDNYVLRDAREPAQVAADAEQAPAAITEQSIAVLPFVNMSGDPDQEYFSDGITEEILNTLVAIDDLRVAGRTSSFSFKGKDVDLPTIGEQLNVTNILEGSVRRSGNQLRITAQLVSAADGFHLWSHTYDRELADIFDIQEEIAGEIAKVLRLELGLNVAASVNKRQTDNLDAYTWYLRGIALRRKGSLDGSLAAIDALLKSIELDPDYLPAPLGHLLVRGSAQRCFPERVGIPASFRDSRPVLR